jgi:hypothetical protein
MKIEYLAILVAALVICGMTLVSANSVAKESRWNREVLCIGILHNENNTARVDPRVLELCEGVGIFPTEGGE